MPCKPATAAKPQAETPLTPARSFRDDNFLYSLFQGRASGTPAPGLSPRRDRGQRREVPKSECVN